ncbi:MAG TPA: 2OG-Fe(II) oxygenase [Steroidobacteraceae bacterium]|nr:2OG-Fe(II) oxygenase [Steroidobacteraceae bacterium]
MIKTSRRVQVEGRDLVVFDDLITAAESGRYAVALAHAAFTKTESARPESVHLRHWVCEMPLDNLPNLSLWSATSAALREMRPTESYRPYRCYTNFASFGDVLLTHVDALPDRRELTALWYLCEQWDPEWGGETLFFDDANDAQVAVAPKPGRLVIFDGAIRHAGRPPNRNCFIGRYTFAIKLRQG